MKNNLNEYFVRNKRKQNEEICLIISYQLCVFYIFYNSKNNRTTPIRRLLKHLEERFFFLVVSSEDQTKEVLLPMREQI